MSKKSKRISSTEGSKKFMDIRKFQDALADKKLNPYIDISNPDKVLIHFVEEVGEFVKAYRKSGFSEGFCEPERAKKFSEELGDIMILLAFLAESVDVDLQQAVLDKLRANIENKKFFGSLESFS
jgi:NTP pyrophosphatase (non-canonical NTP hydrolase)